MVQQSLLQAIIFTKGWSILFFHQCREHTILWSPFFGVRLYVVNKFNCLVDGVQHMSHACVFRHAVHGAKIVLEYWDGIEMYKKPVEWLVFNSLKEGPNSLDWTSIGSGWFSRSRSSLLVSSVLLSSDPCSSTSTTERDLILYGRLCKGSIVSSNEFGCSSRRAELVVLIRDSADSWMGNVSGGGKLGCNSVIAELLALIRDTAADLLMLVGD